MYLELCYLKTQQVCQVLRVCLALHTYTLNYDRVREFFLHIFREQNPPVTLTKGPRFLQLVLENSQAWSHSTYEMRMPIVSKVQLYFHTVSGLCRKLIMKKLSIIEIAVISAMEYMVAQPV